MKAAGESVNLNPWQHLRDDQKGNSLEKPMNEPVPMVFDHIRNPSPRRSDMCDNRYLAMLGTPFDRDSIRRWEEPAYRWYRY